MLKEIALLGVFENLDGELKQNLSNIIDRLFKSDLELSVFKYLFGFLAALAEFNDEEGLIEFTSFGESMTNRILLLLE